MFTDGEPDIYFRDGYGKVNEKIEGGTAQIFRFNCEYGVIVHQFIKRRIPETITGGRDDLYDIITPYGYGGPLIIDVDTDNKDELTEEFGRAFGEYCADNRIVSEFIRFYPVYRNHEPMEKIYNPICVRHTVGTDLAGYEDPVAAEFSKSCRKNIRRCINRGITYKVTEHPEKLDGFKEVYYSTMKRDKAEDFYYFGDDYFNGLISRFRDNLLFVEAIYENKTIAAGIYFISDGIIDIHLSGTLSDYLGLNPAYVLRYAVTVWGKEHGYSMIHHGGGTSNAPDNSLYLFKKQFGQNTEFEFYVGKKVWNRQIYDELCRNAGIESNSGDITKSAFFPEYRGNVNS